MSMPSIRSVGVPKVTDSKMTSVCSAELRTMSSGTKNTVPSWGVAVVSTEMTFVWRKSSFAMVSFTAASYPGGATSRIVGPGAAADIAPGAMLANTKHLFGAVHLLGVDTGRVLLLGELLDGEAAGLHRAGVHPADELLQRRRHGRRRADVGDDTARPTTRRTPATVGTAAGRPAPIAATTRPTRLPRSAAGTTRARIRRSAATR